MKALLLKILNALKSIGKGNQEQQTPPPVIQPPRPEKEDSTKPIPVDSVDTVTLKWGVLKLPARGRFVIESHYATKAESFDYGGKKLFPTSSADGIAKHLQTSAELFARQFPELFKKYFKDSNDYISKVFNQSFEKVWTPANDGGTNYFGQGARGNVKPTVDEEMWQANMMFTKLVPAGTKFLLRNPVNGKECVVQMGYEIGPGSKSFLGGAVPEVHWWLGSNNSTELELLPVSQGAPLGPVVTEQGTTDPSTVKSDVLPSRSEVEAFVKGIIDGTTYNPQASFKYNGLTEKNGKNRSLEIDIIIKRQGGALGEPYCMYGQQDILDAIRKKFNVVIDLPEGGSTQSFWNDSKKEYKVQNPGPLCIGIYRQGSSWSGHAVLAMSPKDMNGEYATFEFNTNLSATMLERDGEGCGYRTRNVKGYINYSLRGFVDIYAAMKLKES